MADQIPVGPSIPVSRELVVDSDAEILDLLSTVDVEPSPQGVDEHWVEYHNRLVDTVWGELATRLSARVDAELEDADG